MAIILFIEDELQIQEAVKLNLEKEGFTVIAALDGEQGLELARRDKPDLILLDLTPPLINGFDICKTLRVQKDTQTIPIIILSDSHDIADKIIGLELGADDYLAKPFNPRELFARIKARLREVQRKCDTENSSLKWGRLKIAKDSYTVTLDERPLNLTVKEFELLVLFVTNPYQVFSRECLVQKIWGNLSRTSTRALDVHISHLRNKLKTLGPVLDSVRGVGYTFTHRE